MLIQLILSRLTQGTHESLVSGIGALRFYSRSPKVLLTDEDRPSSKSSVIL